MFESAELGHSIDKATYAREAPRLREALLNAQYDLAQGARFPVVIVIGGVDGAGKGETVNLLNAWMDPRHIRTHAFPEPSDVEREHPRMWRFWQALPGKGRIAILFGAWHTQPIVERVYRRSSKADLARAVGEIVRFERMLADEGVLLLKFWFHLSKQQQRLRLRALEKNALTRWRVTETDWERFKIYGRFREVSADVLRQTSTAETPWTVVEGADPRYRSLTVARSLLDALRARLDRKSIRSRPQPHQEGQAPPPLDRRNLLEALDLTRKLPKVRYERGLERWQGRLSLLSRHRLFRRHSVVIVFEGQDAAGKGGAIRRITGALDARTYRGIPIAAPNEEERAQPYLWRFWRQLPRRGCIAIFDRSWYGRVLVERVEGYCEEHDWRRAYSEINDFEEQLVRNDTVLVKFWLEIDKDEQLKRFNEREQTGFKRFKITAEDWRNRKKWGAYRRAACDMIDRTSTAAAPWTLVEANDKNHARIQVLKTLCERIAEAL